MDGWRELYRAAPDLDAKREVVRRRALAAGGAADDCGITLPAGLRQCLGLAELKAHASMTGHVVAMRSVLCDRCGDEASVGETLCQVCTWLGGSRP